ncbi:metal-dependent hydrolase [Planctomycetaceae bacterium SH139]
MADFKTHITASTIAGAAYGYWGSATQGMPLESSLVAAGLCSVSGMLPDLDSDSGIPLRETTMFASAVVPMLALGRFRELEMTPESMVLAAGLIYVLLRFVIAEFFKRYTVHRGMWHSIPAAASAGLLAFLIMPSAEEIIRVYKTLAVVLGFMVHLILDEIWSIQFRGGHFRLKKSFGTALKFWGPRMWANFSVYVKLALLLYLAYNDTNLFHEMKDLRNELRRPSELRWGESEWQGYIRALR